MNKRITKQEKKQINSNESIHNKSNKVEIIEDNYPSILWPKELQSLV